MSACIFVSCRSSIGSKGGFLRPEGGAEHVVRKITEYSTAEIRRMRLLGIALDLTRHGTDQDVPLDLLAERLAAETGIGRITITDELRLLQQDGHVNFFETLGGGYASVTASGANSSVEFELERSSTQNRRVYLRDVYLRWLYERIEERGSDPTPDDFLKLGSGFFGFPYSAKDIEKSGEWLKNSGFVDGPGTWGCSAPLRPTLTQKGIYTVENQRSVGDPPPSSGTSYTNNIHGSANIAQGNHDVQQHLIHSEMWVDQGLQLANVLEQALPTMATDLGDALREQLIQFRSELQGEAKPSSIRRIATTIGDFLSDTGAGALGGILGTQVIQLLASLPS